MHDMIAQACLITCKLCMHAYICIHELIHMHNTQACITHMHLHACKYTQMHTHAHSHAVTHTIFIYIHTYKHTYVSGNYACIICIYKCTCIQCRKKSTHRCCQFKSPYISACNLMAHLQVLKIQLLIMANIL